MSHIEAVRPVFRAVLRTVVPDAAAMEEGDWLEVEALIEAAMRRRPEKLQRRLVLFFRCVQWLPVLRYGRRFTSLGAPARTRFLSYLEDHPLQLVRTGFWGVRTLVFLGYYGRPQTARVIGYAADSRGWEALG